MWERRPWLRRRKGSEREDGIPADDGFKHADVAPGFGRALQRVGIEQDEVGEFARLQRAPILFLEMLPRGVDGVGAQGFPHGDALFGAENLSR